MAAVEGGEHVAESPGPFRPGDLVKGRFLDDEWYAATIERAVGDSLYEIAWLDGDTEDCLKRGHELLPMRYHAELGCYVEASASQCAAPEQRSVRQGPHTQSAASERSTGVGSDAKSDTTDSRAAEGDEGAIEAEEEGRSSCPQAQGSSPPSLAAEGDRSAEEEEEDWMEQMVAALDREVEEERGPCGQAPEGRHSQRSSPPQRRSRTAAMPSRPRLAEEPSQCSQMQGGVDVLLQAPTEVVDLRARVARQALQMAKPPPVVSFTEMWCYHYFLWHAAPKERLQTGPLTAEVGDLFLAVGSPGGGVAVREARGEDAKQAQSLLAPGSLVRALDRHGDLLRYELLTGSGPASGWVDIGPRGQRQVAKVATGASVEIDESTGENARPWGALPIKTCRLVNSGDCLHCRCRIPVGGRVVASSEEGDVIRVHAECMTRLLCKAQGAFCARLEEERDEAEAKEEQERAWKRLLHMEKNMQESLRAKYDIGWREELVPCNIAPAKQLGLRLEQRGMCCLAVDEDQLSMRLARTSHPGVAVNLEYLSIALQVGLLEGTQPWFSLDPVDPTCPTTMLTKNFGPEWLAGTSVGDVLFQADYYLKELSMGQFKQPLPGMTSCWDFAGGAIGGPEWDARIWFVVLEAEVNISEDDVLIPCVKMGVEARELVSGSYEDAPVTRPDHPLVKYAEMFTREFDAIADQVSVVYYLRELAKASALAKFLADNGYDARSGEWLRLAAAARECQKEAPRLWSRRLASAADAPAAAALAAKEGGTNMLYGGVDLSLARFAFQQPKRVAARLSLEAELDRINASVVKPEDGVRRPSPAHAVPAPLKPMPTGAAQEEGLFLY